MDRNGSESLRIAGYASNSVMRLGAVAIPRAWIDEVVLGELHIIWRRIGIAAQAGLLPACPRLTFATVAAPWLELFETMVAVGERRARTLESHRGHLDHHLIPARGRRRIAILNVDDIAGLIRALAAEGRASRTIAGALATLGSILRYALRHAVQAG